MRMRPSAAAVAIPSLLLHRSACSHACSRSASHAAQRFVLFVMRAVILKSIRLKHKQYVKGNYIQVNSYVKKDRAMMESAVREGLQA